MNREIFEKQNFGNQLGFGKSPCLLVIDFTISFAEPDILGGGNILSAIENTKDLLKISRKKLLPIIFTKVVLDPAVDQNLLFAKKAPALFNSTADSYLSNIVDSLQPLQNETIIEKKQASAFFQTNLHELLIQDNIDTVIMIGCTTSGCVRASAVDCISLNLRPIIVADCVGDRSLESHELSLFEMNSKYADVVLKKDTIEYLQNL